MQISIKNRFLPGKDKTNRLERAGSQIKVGNQGVMKIRWYLYQKNFAL
jgi:hypothetical protein